MPALTNQKHERFAQLLAKGKTADKAYVEAGYRPDPPNASRLTRNDKVQARLAELQERAAMKVELTIADIVRQLAEDRAFAIEQEAPAAAISATMGQAKVLGLIVDKAQMDASLTATVSVVRREIVRPQPQHPDR